MGAHQGGVLAHDARIKLRLLNMERIVLQIVGRVKVRKQAYHVGVFTLSACLDYNGGVERTIVV